ncbi:MAG: ATP-binding protein, partial [Acidobacteria bacterium]|nr:ATP-binding protein [Acidobacteriota bacterium]
MNGTSKAELKRQTFSVSRELEYFTEAELTTQTGYGREDWWPRVVAKELIDNSLDACEQAGTPPRIDVNFQGDSLTVADNGPGLPAGVLDRVLDFGTRTSDKAAYVAPTRGAQGNAF